MFPEGYGSVGITFIAFEGYEIIVQAGEEVQDPRRSIPRAVFKSLLIVIPIYVLVAITAVGAVVPQGDEATWQFLGEQQELGLALAADRFMPYGTIVILIGGLLSTISALNARTYSSTRVSFAMGRDQVLPDAFAKVHSRFKTPYIALAATGGIIVFMVVAIPIEDVAAAADVMFLLLFLQVNYAVMRIRNEFGDRLEYGYLMPFYPWVPIIGIVTKAFLAVYLFRFSPLAWFYAAGWIMVGVGVFFSFARGRVAGEDEPRITYEDKRGMRSGRSILAPVANPRRVDTVVRVAAALAAARDSEVVVLNVVRVPRSMPIAEGRKYTSQAEPVVEAVRALDEDLPGVSLSTVVGIGRKVSSVINTTAQREDADVVVVGWHGRRARGQRPRLGRAGGAAHGRPRRGRGQGSWPAQPDRRGPGRRQAGAARGPHPRPRRRPRDRLRRQRAGPVGLAPRRRPVVGRAVCGRRPRALRGPPASRSCPRRRRRGGQCGRHVR